MTLAAWIAARGVALWQVEDLVAPVRAAIGLAEAEAAVPEHGSLAAFPPSRSRPRRAAAPPPPGQRATTHRGGPVDGEQPAGPTVAIVLVSAAAGQQAAAAPPLLPPPVAPTPMARGRSRLAASVWLIARGGSNRALLGGQLGASQAGMRLTYALDARRRLALSARLATPLAGAGREGAVGLDWQPTRAPLHLVVEQRVSLDGGRGGPTVGVIGGFGPSRMARGIVVEGYGQAGVIARDGGEAFADGALRAAHPLTALGAVRLDIGVGAWGGAQRGATRLDVGPSLGLRVPIGQRSIRLSADWRQRVAGDARPGSGPALSIGSDF